jgi:hypothetical protein
VWRVEGQAGVARGGAHSIAQQRVVRCLGPRCLGQVHGARSAAQRCIRGRSGACDC